MWGTGRRAGRAGILLSSFTVTTYSWDHSSLDGPALLFSWDTEAAGLGQLKTLLLPTDLLWLHVSYWIGKGPSVCVPTGTA